jgi:hypothetical protein
VASHGRATAHHRHEAEIERLFDLLRADEVDVHVDAGARSRSAARESARLCGPFFRSQIDLRHLALVEEAAHPAVGIHDGDLAETVRDQALGCRTEIAQMSRRLELPQAGTGEARRGMRSVEAPTATHGNGRSGASDLMERVCERANLQAALKRVRKNKAAPASTG